MKRVKGCLNKGCVACEKTKYKEVDEYCLKCGNRLHFVCKECFTRLPDSSKNICVRCQAKKDDRKEETRKKLAPVAIGVAGLAVVGKKVMENGGKVAQGVAAVVKIIK